MPKLRGPLLSLGARGGLSKLFALVRRRGQNIIERRPIPTDAKSPAQLFSRHMFSKCADLWHTLSEAEKAEWERLATPRHMTGYAWYISQCLRPNPGIYLPLQGGTMSGNIDMGKNRLLKLPEPIDDQESATKGYADTHGMVAHEDTHVKDGSDEIDSALAIEAMAGLANTKIWQGDAAGRPVPVDLPAAGDMLKATYDPNDDGKIALAQLVDAVCSETEADNKIAAQNHPTIVRKPDDQIVNNSTTLVNDEDLVIAVGADDVWFIYFRFNLYSPSSTPDIRYLFSVPAGGAFTGSGTWSVTAATGFTNLTTERTVAIGPAVYSIQFFGVYVGGGTAGNLQLEWAQREAAVEDTKMKEDSMMVCQQVA